MKKILLFLFLTLPFILLAQQENPGTLYGVFSMDDNEFRSLVSSKRSQVKMSENEITEICRIIGNKKAEYFMLNEKANQSIKYGANGLPIGKADPEIMRDLRIVKNMVYDSIYKILGEEKYELLRRTLIDENGRRSSERLKKTANKKK
ncbi:MAG: hypothetical protein CVT93_04250 [Bacteroidetes bacterium HGW-Bacteroidetes-10]|jgi:hypothetical protein|nr:MAG: hypothetical protein CVT93_04250 [Bacteroidetes bacterium HGW-Bacteroidetes-10]